MRIQFGQQLFSIALISPPDRRGRRDEESRRRLQEPIIDDQLVGGRCWAAPATEGGAANMEMEMGPSIRSWSIKLNQFWKISHCGAPSSSPPELSVGPSIVDLGHHGEFQVFTYKTVT
ncbi:4-hydroxy-tetrahydrodipicolinate synthase [Trichinella pseudospiralis]